LGTFEPVNQALDQGRGTALTVPLQTFANLFQKVRTQKPLQGGKKSDLRTFRTFFRHFAPQNFPPFLVGFFLLSLSKRLERSERSVIPLCCRHILNLTKV
jgi:hypothetical protein